MYLFFSSTLTSVISLIPQLQYLYLISIFQTKYRVTCNIASIIPRSKQQTINNTALYSFGTLISSDLRDIYYISKITILLNTFLRDMKKKSDI